MTSLQHHSHHMSHHNASSVGVSGTIGAVNLNNNLNTSMNNSTSNLSPVMQRKIETQQQILQPVNQGTGSLLNRFSGGSVGANIGLLSGAGVDYDTTSIASVSESSHWSGGGADDLDNIALVNGSDTNTMENKDWSTYLKMAKNGYNSSDDENNNDEEDHENDNSDGETKSKFDENEDEFDKEDEKSTNKSSSLNENKINKKNSNFNNQKSKSQKSISKLKNSSKNSLINSKSETINKTKSKTETKNKNKSTSSKNSDNIHNDNDLVKNKNRRHEQTSELFNEKKSSKKIFQDSHFDNKNDDAENLSSNFDDDDEDDISVEDEQAHNKNKISSKECELNEHNEENEDEDVDEDDDDDDEDEDDDEDDLDDDDIWTIKPKLFSYYEKQFKTMQPNINGFISGAVAKPFFERSKLPLNELSKIWELSDVTKDGQLSFAEFCTAMHLVVLRVRNFDLPNELPPKLQPYAPLIDFNSETTTTTASISNLIDISDQVSSNKNQTDDSMLNLSDSEDLTISSPTQSSARINQAENKPLVFSVKPQIPSDVQIAHPVALRYNSHQFQQHLTSGYQQTASEVQKTYPNVAANPIPNNNTNFNNGNGASVLVPEPPPRHSRSSSLVATSSNAPTAPSVIMTPKILQQQPVVPPRITSPPPAHHQQHQHHTHHLNSESDSAGLSGVINQHQNTGALLPPPPPPPPLPHHHHHHLHHFQQNRNMQQSAHLHHVNQQPGPSITTPITGSQFNVRAPPLPPPISNQTPIQSHEDVTKSIEKLLEQMNALNIEKLRRTTTATINNSISSAIPTSNTLSTADIEALTASIRAQTEQNQILRRIFSELEKELRSLTDNRIALEIKLDFLNTASTAVASSISTPSALVVNQTVVSNVQTPLINANNLATNNSINSNSNKKPAISIVPSTPIVASQTSALSSIVNAPSNLISSTPLTTQTISANISTSAPINNSSQSIGNVTITPLVHTKINI